MNANEYGDCGLCGLVIKEGVSLLPFGNICLDCVNEIESKRKGAN
jgi:RNA polymerase-binding transcription factor DksA